MRALITGSHGQLGDELAALLPNAYLADHSALDVTNEAQVWEALTAHRLDTVFHCAAMTDVDACERNPALARRVNTVGTRNLAAVCGALGIYLVALSTDYVFDGRRRVKGVPAGNLEDSETHPVSIYGRSKLEAEMAVRMRCPRHAIVRTSWLYGSGPRNFVRTVLSRAAAGQPLAMVQTEVSSPTWARDLARALVRLAQQRGTGTFHLTNAGTASRYEWAREILALAGYDPDAVTVAESYPLPARRPAYSALINSRAAAMGITPQPWRDALSAFLASDAGIQAASTTERESIA